MGGYTKLFSDIITSSIWNEDDKTRVLWITMLALSNAGGFVSGAPTSLALLARMSKEDCYKSLDVLSSPDPESRTPDHEGRRIERVQGGWQILNYEAYRERLSDDPNAVNARERMRKYRAGKRNVTQRSETGGNSASASASGDASSSDKRKVFVPPTREVLLQWADEKSLSLFDPDAFIDFYAMKGWMVGKTKMKSWPHAAHKAYREGWAQEGHPEHKPSANKKASEPAPIDLDTPE